MTEPQQQTQVGNYLAQAMQIYRQKALEVMKFWYQRRIRSWLNGRTIQSFASLLLIGAVLSMLVASCGSSSANNADVKLRLVSFSVTKATMTK